MTDLVTSFMDGTQPELLPEPTTEYQLIHGEPRQISERDAKSLIRKAYGQAANLYDTLCEIHDTQAFLHDGHTSFKSWYETFSKRVDHVMSYMTFYRHRAYDRVRVILIDAGRETAGLTKQNAYLLQQEVTDAYIPAVWDLAKQEAAAYKPLGKALDNWFPGKVLTSHLETAIARHNHSLTHDLTDDPFREEGDSPGNVVPTGVFFDATDDGRIVVDEALVTTAPEWIRPPVLIDAPPVPLKETMGPRRIAELDQKPPAPVMPNSDKSQFEEETEICLAFVGVEPHAMDDDVLWVSGTDGPNVYTIPVRKSELRGKV